MQRRTFLQWATHGLGALFGAVLGLPAAAYVLDPRNRKAKPSAFKTVARLGDLEKDKPVQVVLRDVRKDAYTLHPDDVIGRVWLVKRDGDKVEAYTASCPHLGCSINYDAGKNLFICPCHNGTWDANCKKMATSFTGQPNAAPRDMDSLECRRDPDNTDVIQVKYENFKQGLTHKEPKA